MVDTKPTPTGASAKNGAREQQIQRLTKLPPLNPSAVKLLSLKLGVDDPLDQVAEIFASDPALAAELLVTANSPLYGARARVSTIRHAITVLGLERIQALAATVAAASYMRMQFKPELVRAAWAHAVATGVIAEHLARHSGSVSGSLLYTAGLLHDMGRLGQLASLKAAYQAFMEDEFGRMEESLDLERRAFGITHCDAGEFLAHTWGLPGVLCTCARSHHDEVSGDSGESEVVGMACILADGIGYPELRLQTPRRNEVTDKWARECSSSSFLTAVEQKIQSFVF